MALIEGTSSFLSPENISRSCSLYFTRLSIDEEGLYCAVPEALAHEIRETIRTVPEAFAVVEVYRQLANIDLLPLLNSVRLDTSEPYLHKLYQTGLHALVGLYLRGRFGLKIDSVGFYSGGATAAFLFAGAYTPADYIRHIFSFNRLVRESMAVEGRKRDLSQVLLMGDPTTALDAYVSARLHEDHTLSELYVKDRRQPHALLVAGSSEPLARLVGETESRFPSVKSRRSPILKHRYASHSPYLNADALSANLDERLFSAPNTTIVGTCGELLRAGENAPSAAKKIFADGVIGPMDTGRAIDVIAQQNQRILVIGGLHAAKVLAGLALPTGVSIDLAPEFVVNGDSRVVGKKIYEGRIAEDTAG